MNCFARFKACPSEGRTGPGKTSTVSVAEHAKTTALHLPPMPICNASKNGALGRWHRFRCARGIATSQASGDADTLTKRLGSRHASARWHRIGAKLGHHALGAESGRNQELVGTSSIDRKLDWLARNDGVFKHHLDRYKYPERTTRQIGMDIVKMRSRHFSGR
jgi:hypothetical protein